MPARALAGTASVPARTAVAKLLRVHALHPFHTVVTSKYDDVRCISFYLALNLKYVERANAAMSVQVKR